jgi:hypothetical protein
MKQVIVASNAFALQAVCKAYWLQKEPSTARVAIEGAAGWD